MYFDREDDQMNSKAVAIVKVEENIRSAVNHGLSLIGGLEVSDGERFAIKPNLCVQSKPETGATTDVRIVQALVNYLKKRRKCTISIVESDTHARDCNEVFSRLGYSDLERTPTVRLVNLSSDKMVATDFKGHYFKEMEIPQTMSSCDFFITVAKLKTSVVQRMSGACKNQFGCLSVREKRLYHPFLSEVLFDLNTLFKPHLCVIDGIVGMDGRGPTDGFPKTMDILLFGRNPVAVDAVLCHIMEIDPFEVPYLRYAFENGLGEIRLENIDLAGEPLEKVRNRFTFVPEKAYTKMELGLNLGRHLPPIRNLGILFFLWGSYQAGKESIVRTKRHRQEGRPSLWNFMKKALWTRKWNF